MRGRKPTPTALRILNGNPSKRPLPENEPKPASGLPPCPKRLQGEAREAWKRFGKILVDTGVVSRLDATIVETLCDTYALYVNAMAEVVKYGPVFMKEAGPGEMPEVMMNPHEFIARTARKDLLKMLSELGMTPTSRTRVSVANAMGPRKDPIDEFLDDAVDQKSG